MKIEKANNKVAMEVKESAALAKSMHPCSSSF